MRAIFTLFAEQGSADSGGIDRIARQSSRLASILTTGISRMDGPVHRQSGRTSQDVAGVRSAGRRDPLARYASQRQPRYARCRTSAANANEDPGTQDRLHGPTIWNLRFNRHPDCQGSPCEKAGESASFLKMA